ncbi:AraC-like DNA-binding protein/quercetin dioxygenase-like cupin family protein [Gracilibacillus halotolerans]|uniref:AraC-like DNA-binding protein/quercetin dioxygenase-like cupin family protein n=1 Tax=Gracilibacillus halotolerans TaxID=74386 RepID=A0A841RJQ0_9BACI|nr:AraC family transcriptional regulator [Gracilibacillus halotolerans]MBB6512202.1 AraC-like DNA-binding protein/quercetin dioxygenase-like cupin family protein [Gracilibacillus halotolerans]
MLKAIQLNQTGVKLYESKHHPGDRVEEHHHPIFQLLYTLEGTGDIKLDGKQYHLEQDHLAFIVPYTPHAIVSDKKMTVLVLAFSEEALSLLRDDALQKKLSKSKIIQIDSFTSSDIRQLLRTLLYEQANESEHQKLGLHIALAQLLLLAVRGERKSIALDANMLRAERLKEYIDTHYFEWINAEDLAARLGMSTRHMNTIFKETYSVTPIQYLTEVRIGLAKKMLAETDKDIASICFEVGFESISTFYRTFKNLTSLSPNKYRHKEKRYTGKAN